MTNQKQIQTPIENDGVSMKVSKEFKDLCDAYKKKVSEVTWNAVDYSYPEITRIIARKIKESGVV